MCGRYTLRTPAATVATWFGVQVGQLSPRYNIAPSQSVPVIRLSDSGQRQLATVRWGLVPSWADDPKIGYRMINARAETVASKPAFRHAFRHHRCLVVADGFYEWQELDSRKQPYYVRLDKDEPFAFAGLWESWSGGGQPLQSCTIVTTEANRLMKPLHDRMPVILSPKAYTTWLAADAPVDQLRELLRPWTGDDLVAYPVSTVVNNPRNDIEACIQPISR